MGCPGPWWQLDDIGICQRQRYLELWPVLISVVVLVLWTGYAVLVSKRRISLDDAEGTFGTRWHEHAFHPDNASDPAAIVTIRRRGASDKLRLNCELALAVGQTALVFMLWTIHSVAAGYAQWAPNVPLVLVSASLWTLGLVIYRKVGENDPEPLIAKPFSQCAYLYMLMLVIFAMEWYSQIVRPFSPEALRLSVFLLIVSVAQWVILITSPIGDSAARLYTAKGAIPSAEPTSSLLRIMTCCWNSSMIIGATRKPLEPSDVWELREEDHVYSFFESFSKHDPRRSFWWRTIITLRWPLFLNVFFGVTAAFLALSPTLFVNLILKYVEDPVAPRPVAWLYVFGLGFSHLLHTVLVNQAFYQGRILSVGIRGLVIGSVYRKALYRQVAVHMPSDAESEDKNVDSEGTGDGEEAEDEDDPEKFDPNSVGTVINLMSVDSFKVAEFFSYLHDNFASPAILIVSIGYLFKVVGWSIGAGVAVMLVSLPISAYLGAKFSSTQNALMAVTDRRIEQTNEFLHAIRIIKFFAWEGNFVETIMKTRNKELRLLLWRYVIWCGESFVFFLMPVAIITATFWSYVYIQGGNLTSSVAFTALAIFQVVRYPLDDVANLITRVTSCRVSGLRISKYLQEPETPKYKQLESTPDGKIGFEAASFSWSDHEDSFKLKDIDVTFVRGDLNVIVGPTGSGKTSLLLALLGEMNLDSGKVFLPAAAIGERHSAPSTPNGLAETVAYAPQQPWLLNDTIKNNIIFSAPFDKSRYNAVLDACELRRDLEILSRGDQTLIGDKGIALSGGQKQRVSLARVLYSNSRHLIMDDALSAVDSHTAEALYNNAFTGPIANSRTIILVSHNVALTVGRAAHVLVINDGKIVASGEPDKVAASGALGDDDLIRRNAESAIVSRTQSATNLAEMSTHRDTPEEQLAEAAQRLGHDVNGPKHASHGHHSEVGGDVMGVIGSESAVGENDDAPVDDEEERAIGAIPLETYMRYTRELGGIFFFASAAFVLFATPLAEYLESWWVKQWASADLGVDETEFTLVVPIVSTARTAFSRAADQLVRRFGVDGVPHDVSRALSYYALMYLSLGIIYSILGVLRDGVLFFGSVRASRTIFRKLLHSVSRARVRFFDSTPSGRIVNRFSKDMETIDQELIVDLSFFIMCCIDVAVISTVISYVTPSFIPGAALIAAAFTWVGRAYLCASRELKRLESTTRSPIFQQFSETLSGAVVIRAFGDAQRFQRSNWNSVDFNHRPYFFLWVSNRWLAFWSAFMSMAVIVLAGFFLIWNSDTVSAGMAGISLSYAMGFGDAVLWIVRMYSQTEISMNSVERVGEYLDVEQEAPAVIAESRPPASWPQHGTLSFKGLSLRYGPELPLVIKNVSFEVPGGLKVGIVGRTGAGKSTIITALFRLLEPAAGSIEIDGVDISTIGLADLRENLAIIPQDPTLFKGTLRSNLSMFSEYSDDEMFGVLAKVQLVPENVTSSEAAAAAIEQTAEEDNTNRFLNLDSEISEGGNNLSQGQRQLICLARSILKQPRVLLLDEATASIDYDTDAQIQHTIRTAFTDVTILTIAHRLRTIADYDRILVLEHGEVAQFGQPDDLLEDKEGIFYQMCAKSGELETLISLANDARKSRT